MINNLSENADAFQWDFGDGSATSSDVLPDHAYTQAGTFLLELNAEGGGQFSTYSITVTVEAGPMAAVRLRPAQATLSAAESLQFSAEVIDEFGNQVEGAELAWSASENAGGIDESGQFTATTKAGSYREAITITAATNGDSRQASSDVVIDPGPPVEISVEPSVVASDIEASQELTVKVSDAHGNQIPNPLTAWSIDSGIGTVDDNGVFTAGTKAGFFAGAVKVEVVQGSESLSASLDVVISPDPLASIQVTPALPIVRKNQSLRLTAIGIDQHGNPVPNLVFLWSSDGLNVNRSGIVVAGNQGGLYEVKVEASFKGVEQSTSVNVAVPPAFILVGEMSQPRTAHTATLMANGQVLLVGGVTDPKKIQGGNGSVLASAELYDPSKRSFMSTGSAATARRIHTATALQDGTVLITRNYAWPYGQEELYDSSVGTFRTTDSMGPTRYNGAAVLLQDGDVLLTGGAFGGDVFDSADLYDPNTGKFSSAGGMATARARHTATVLADGRVLVAGGSSITDNFRSAEVYDLSTQSFSPTGNMPRALQNHTATLLGDGRVLIAGSSKVFFYDPINGTFSPAIDMSADRKFHTATLLPNGDVLILGGLSGVSTLASVELYNASTGSFTALEDMLTPRWHHTATLLPDGSVLIAGGAGPGLVSLDSAELFIP